MGEPESWLVWSQPHTPSFLSHFVKSLCHISPLPLGKILEVLFLHRKLLKLGKLPFASEPCGSASKLSADVLELPAIRNGG